MPALLDGITVNGHAISEIRRARRLSLTELSRRCDPRISVSYLSDLELGNRAVMSRERLVTLAEALGCASPKALTTEPHLFDPEEAAA